MWEKSVLLILRTYSICFHECVSASNLASMSSLNCRIALCEKVSQSISVRSACNSLELLYGVRLWGRVDRHIHKWSLGIGIFFLVLHNWCVLSYTRVGLLALHPPCGSGGRLGPLALDTPGTFWRRREPTLTESQRLAWFIHCSLRVWDKKQAVSCGSGLLKKVRTASPRTRSVVWTRKTRPG